MNFGTITLIGSGEFSDSMARVYRSVLARLSGEPQLVFLDTPAGFELNADEISARAAAFFERLGLGLQVASYKHSTQTTALQVEAALRKLRRADLIIAGPGSPSYAVRHWQGSPIWNSVIERFEHGAHLVLASAAAIAVGALALPVYEIFKVGQDPHWIDGLNLFVRLGLNLAVVPHWNNAEGGSFDTRFCFMGERRLNELELLLDEDVIVLGIDEYTALTFDPALSLCTVQGAGTVTVHCSRQSLTFASGSSFTFEQLRARTCAEAQTPPAAAVASSTVPDATTRYLRQLALALEEAGEPDIQRDLIDQAHDTMHELSAGWIESDHLVVQENIAPYVQALIDTRTQLRAAKQYGLADEIRRRLATLNIILQDSSSGTTWRRIEG